MLFMSAAGQRQGDQHEWVPIPHASRKQLSHAFGRSIKIRRVPADKESMQDRRTEVRMMCADMVEVSWRNEHGRAKRAIAILEDISTSGACLQLEAPVPLGAEICWDTSRCKFHGQVRYCVYRETGYFVGVEMESGSQWSKRVFRPRHLLDLRDLVGAGR